MHRQGHRVINTNTAAHVHVYTATRTQIEDTQVHTKGHPYVNTCKHSTHCMYERMDARGSTQGQTG